MKRLKSANTTPNRGQMNVLSLIITISVLFIALQLTDGTYVNKISRMSENVDKALSKIMDQEAPDYKPLETNSEYFSDTTFNPRGMAGLYNLTKTFMDLVLPENFLPSGKVTVHLR